MARMIIGGYELLDRIGGGGTGVVHEGRSVSSGDPVAIRMVAPQLCMDQEYVSRLRQRMPLLLALREEGVVRVLDHIEQRGRHFVVTERFSGGSLRALLEAEGGGLSAVRALRIAGAVCRILARAHARGVVHRDLRPENVILGDGDEVKLADFEMALVPQSDKLMSVGVRVGLPHYQSPEQLHDEWPQGPQSDVYSVGVVLYEMLVGVVPFSPEEQMKRAAGRRVDLHSRWPGGPLALPPEVRAVVDSALRVDPAERTGSAQEMADLIRGALEVARSRCAEEPAAGNAKYVRAVALHRAGRLQQALRELEELSVEGRAARRAARLEERIRAEIAEGRGRLLPGGAPAPPPVETLIQQSVVRAEALEDRARPFAALMEYRRALCLDPDSVHLARKANACRRAARREVRQIIRAAVLGLVIDMAAVAAYAGMATLRRQAVSSSWNSGLELYYSERWDEAAERFHGLVLAEPDYVPEGVANLPGTYLMASWQGECVAAQWLRFRQLNLRAGSVPEVLEVLVRAKEDLESASTGLSHLQVRYASAQCTGATEALDSIEHIIDLAHARETVIDVRRAAGNALDVPGDVKEALRRAEAVLAQAEDAMQKGDFGTTSDLANLSVASLDGCVERVVASSQCRLAELSAECSDVPRSVRAICADVVRGLAALSGRLGEDPPRFDSLRLLVEGGEGGGAGRAEGAEGAEGAEEAAGVAELIKLAVGLAEAEERATHAALCLGSVEGLPPVLGRSLAEAESKLLSARKGMRDAAQSLPRMIRRGETPESISLAVSSAAARAVVAIETASDAAEAAEATVESSWRERLARLRLACGEIASPRVSESLTLVLDAAEAAVAVRDHSLVADLFSRAGEALEAVKSGGEESAILSSLSADDGVATAAPDEAPAPAGDEDPVSLAEVGIREGAARLLLAVTAHLEGGPEPDRGLFTELMGALELRERQVSSPAVAGATDAPASLSTEINSAELHAYIGVVHTLDWVSCDGASEADGLLDEARASFERVLEEGEGGEVGGLSGQVSGEVLPLLEKAGRGEAERDEVLRAMGSLQMLR